MKKIFLMTFILFLVPLYLTGQSNQNNDSLDIRPSLVINPEYKMTRIDKKYSDYISLTTGVLSEQDELGINIEKLVFGHKYLYGWVFSDYSIEFNNICMGLYYKRYLSLNRKADFIYGLVLGIGEVKLEHKEKIVLPFSEGLHASDSYFYIKPMLGVEYKIINNISVNINLGYTLISGLDLKTQNSTVMDSFIDFSEKDFNDFYISASIKYLIKLF